MREDLIERLRAVAESDMVPMDRAMQLMLEAAAALEAAREDAERYRWLRVHSYVEVRCDSPRVDGWHPEQLDAAIDQARGKGCGAGKGEDRG